MDALVPSALAEGRLRGNNPRTRGKPTVRYVCAAVVIGAMTASACSGVRDAGPASSAAQFHFVNATAPGQLIPASQREPAAQLQGTLIGGGSYDLVNHKGKVVLVNFWASWCAPCVIESPMLQALYARLKPGGVDFVGIDIKDERQAAQSFIHDMHMTYPMIYDELGKTSLRLAVPTGGLPVTTVVDRAGRVAAVYVGALQRGDITLVLQRLAAEAP